MESLTKKEDKTHEKSKHHIHNHSVCACVCACASHQCEAGPCEVAPSPQRALTVRNPRLSLSIAPIMLPVGRQVHSSWNMEPALDTTPALRFDGRYVNFKVSGTAIAGVDYVLLVSPARIGQSGYGVIQVKTLPDQRGSSFRQAYSVMVTLEPGPGYEVGAASSATMWIKP